MEAYATVPPDDPFAASKSMFTALAAELADPAASGLTACELEDLLDERGREVLRQLLQDHLDLRAAREKRHARERSAPVTGTDGATRPRLETGHGRLLATLFGTVRVTRCAWRRPGAANFCPADATLSLPAGRHSHSLARLAAVEAARGSFEAAHDAIARRCGPVIGKRQLEQAATGAASDIPGFYAARVPEPCTASTLLVLSADSKGIVMRPGALRAATARAAARLGKMRDPADGRGETEPQADGHARHRLRRRPGQAPPARRDRPARRPRLPPAPARAGGPGQVANRVSPERPCRDDRRRLRRGRSPRPTAPADLGRPGDGAEHQLELIRAEAARRGAAIHIVIDIVHVLEYLWKAAWSLHAAGDPAAEDWVAARALAVLAGNSARAAAEITAEADAASLAGSQRTGADMCVRYLSGKQEFLRYDRALEAGWPIATGVIEGACRHLIADRLDIGGARWGLDGAEAVLTLRAVISTGDFEEYWRFHLAREHQRLYPGIKKGQYALGA